MKPLARVFSKWATPHRASKVSLGSWHILIKPINNFLKLSRLSCEKEWFLYLGISICNVELECSRSGQLHISRAWCYWDHCIHSLIQLILIFENDTFVLHKNVVHDFGQNCMSHLARVLLKLQHRIRRGWYHCNRSISSVTNPHWYLKFEIVTCILHKCVNHDF